MMNLQQLRVLLAVREHGSLTSAAEALHYGVPTVTHHLRTLEAHLQARVVEKCRGGTRLTPLGEMFAIEAEQVLDRLARAERAVADQRDAGLVTLRIATFASLGSRILPAAIAALQHRTSVRVEVVEAEPTDAVGLLVDHAVHAALIYDLSDEPVFDTPQLALHRLLAEPFRVMVANDSPWADTDEIDFTDLSDVSWVMSRSDNDASARVLKRVCRSLGTEPRELMRTDNLYMIHGLVEKGLGLALTTAAAVDTDFDVTLRPARQNLGERNVFYATLRGGSAPAVSWLQELALAEARRLAA